MAHAKLSAICNQVYVSTGATNSYADYACISDSVASCGPVSGILSGLERLHEFDGVLALACDMPLVTHKLLVKLVNAWQNAALNYGMVAWQSRLTGKIQTLAAIYGTSALPFFKEAFSGGHFGLWDIVPEDRRLCLPYGPENEAFFHNCNTLADISSLDSGILESNV